MTDAQITREAEAPKRAGARRQKQPKADTAHEEKSSAPILCKQCRALISHMEALFPMDAERISHVYANPAGFLHEVLTATAAQGLAVAGPPTTEFSWFPGYAWEIAFCANCGSHIGWSFTAVESDSLTPHLFWGLRRQAIILVADAPSAG
jgi:cereblon